MAGMVVSEYRRLSTSPDQTAELARNLGQVLKPGDCLLLDGGIGAGKTHFARCLLQSIQTLPEDVPSPTFTLVQIYDTQIGEVWHADLYRLGSLEELVEIGLTEIFGTAVSIIEWPDRLGDLAPRDALSIRFDPVPVHHEHRTLLFCWSGGDWGARLEGIMNA